MKPPTESAASFRETFEQTLAQSKKPVSAQLLLAIAVIALVFRFCTRPSDVGGCFFQVWVSLVGTGGFGFAMLFLKGPGRTLAGIVLFPLVAGLIVGSLYFAPQALFPFLFFGGAFGAAAWFHSRTQVRYARIAALLLIPLAGYCFYGAQHMSLVSQFRRLNDGSIRKITFTPVEERKTIVIDGIDACNRIARSLATTWPYSPNHDKPDKYCDVAIELTDGKTIQCRIGKGNRVDPETAWIAFDVAVYQNAELVHALERDAPGLWTASTTGR
jgi:hypothetical protein